MFYLHARRTLANVSSDYKHLTPNHTISFENVLIMIRSLSGGFAVRNPYVQNNAIIILIYIATCLPPQLLPVCITPNKHIERTLLSSDYS